MFHRSSDAKAKYVDRKELLKVVECRFIECSISFLDPIGSLVSTLLVGRWLVVGHTFSNCKIVKV